MRWNHADQPALFNLFKTSITTGTTGKPEARNRAKIQSIENLHQLILKTQGANQETPGSLGYQPPVLAEKPPTFPLAELDDLLLFHLDSGESAVKACKTQPAAE